MDRLPPPDKDANTMIQYPYGHIQQPYTNLPPPICNKCDRVMDFVKRSDYRCHYCEERKNSKKILNQIEFWWKKNIQFKLVGWGGMK